MNKLFFAEIHRLFRSGIYRLECAAVLLFSLYPFLLNEYSISPAVDGFLFQIMPIAGILSAVYGSWMIGQEYAFGVIRNKIIIGHSRAEIYFSWLILFFIAGVNLLNISVLSAILGGMIRHFKYEYSAKTLLGCYVMCIGTLFLISAVSVLVLLCIESKMAGLIVCGVVIGILSVSGLKLLRSLEEPEIRLTYGIEAYGQKESVPNQLYVEGDMRRVCEIMLLVNPYGQANYESEAMYDCYRPYISSEAVEHPIPKVLLYSLTESAVLTAGGILMFKKKDIK